MTIPQNAVEIYAELYASGNSQEEFWVWYLTYQQGCSYKLPDQYFNIPDKYLGALPEGTTYGKGSFREARLLVDGQLAGVAFPYPTIYTGGFIPAAWR